MFDGILWYTHVSVSPKQDLLSLSGRLLGFTNPNAAGMATFVRCYATTIPSCANWLGQLLMLPFRVGKHERQATLGCLFDPPQTFLSRSFLHHLPHYFRTLFGSSGPQGMGRED